MQLTGKKRTRITLTFNNDDMCTVKRRKISHYYENPSLPYGFKKEYYKSVLPQFCLFKPNDKN